MNLSLELPQWIISGITIGGIYALVALGFVTIYSVTRVINIAQGEFVMLGAMLTATLHNRMPLALAILVAVIAVTAIGAGVQRVALYPARRASMVTLIMITIGVDIVLRGIALIIWGTAPYSVRPFTPGPPIIVGPAVITRQALWVIASVIVIVVVTYLFFQRTMAGRALRASAANPVAARLVGIRPERMALLAWAGSAALAALGGAVVAPITFATYSMGLDLGLKGFVAAVAGGLTNPAAAVIGGLLLGVLESVGAGLHSGLQDVIAFAVLLVVLIVRQVGILGLRGRFGPRPRPA
ncbi:branched-chain amino acid ABC transporter permease [Sphaerobacter thermophilus]|uniref:Inner-membrane translocator n=1 Tax=Sphaerobacter thermophilus (strain ATCC 49802 / DSM 20745 / KCCM 41009 / NCIMB 13125 / S 6022) TaxID=479434 RepID=D1C8R9_SPHTD|nr:branched-chain amino acid ABC transporter permease [Sphaerobacter thermophilus]ACZ40212.1 inner-membrane translocator [Sphaerobacter thermophilus DSM 20745]